MSKFLNCLKLFLTVMCLSWTVGCAGILKTDNDIDLTGTSREDYSYSGPSDIVEIPNIIFGDSPATPQELSEAPKTFGVYHKVKKGQTLWRIAQTYNASLKEIIRANKIPDIAQLEVNQLVFIPGATQEKEVSSGLVPSSNDFIWPVQGKVVRYFSGTKNLGIDITVPEGTLVKASRTGKVVFADYLTGYGYAVILDHGDGYHSVYANNAKILVSLGQTVLQNDSVSHVGRKNKSSPFLHFQIRKDSVVDNPLYYLP